MGNLQGQCVFVYNNETWAMHLNDMRRLERAKSWMCGEKMEDI